MATKTAQKPATAAENKPAFVDIRYIAIGGDEKYWYYNMVVYQPAKLFGFINYSKRIYAHTYHFPRYSNDPRIDGLRDYCDEWRDRWLRRNGYAA